MKTVISGVDDLPQDLAVIKTYNQVKAVFPSEGVTTTVVVEADDVRSGEAATGIAALHDQVQASDSFLPGTSVTYSDDNTVAEIDVPTRGNGTDAASTNALNEIRDRDRPGDGRPGRGRPPSTSAETRPPRWTPGISRTAGCR